MKKTTKIINGDKVTIYSGRKVDLEDDLAPEYDLTNVEWKTNPYAERLRKQRDKLTVQLEPDIQKIFQTSEQVNHALRLIINAIPKKNNKKLENA